MLEVRVHSSGSSQGPFSRNGSIRVLRLERSAGERSAGYGPFKHFDADGHSSGGQKLRGAIGGGGRSTVPWFDIIDLLNRDPELAFKISAEKWEEIVAGAYKKCGFDEVTLTPRSGDHGRDVIAVKRGLGLVRVIDQVKAYSRGHLVTADDVRALVGVLHGDGASKGFLTTTSDFAPRLRTDPLLTPFMPSRLELINGDQLLARLRDLAASRSS